MNYINFTIKPHMDNTLQRTLTFTNATRDRTVTAEFVPPTFVSTAHPFTIAVPQKHFETLRIIAFATSFASDRAVGGNDGILAPFLCIPKINPFARCVPAIN